MSLAMIFAAALLPAEAAAAAEPPKPPLDLSTASKATEQCDQGDAGEVVVCAKRGESPYRIDADVLQVMRAKEQAANPPRPPAKIADGDPCKVGPNGCPGDGALPLFQMALTAVKMAVKAVEGEDWREPLRTGPTDYERYQKSKARVKAKVGLSTGIRRP